MNTYIFPGGCLPSLAVISCELARRTDMQVADLEDLTLHYVETLRRWRVNFTAHLAALEGLGYDERFRRIWTRSSWPVSRRIPTGGRRTRGSSFRWRPVAGRMIRGTMRPPESGGRSTCSS